MDTVKSSSSPLSSNPNSPIRTLNPSDYDYVSYSSGETTPDHDPPDLTEPEPEVEPEVPESEENEELSLFQPSYSWRHRWNDRFEEPKMSSPDLIQWRPQRNNEFELNLPTDDDLKMEIKPFVSDFISEIKPSVMGAGLSNLGNTCFLNSIMQCFIHTVPLLQSLSSSNHTYPCENHMGSFCIICAFRELIELSLHYTGGSIQPWRLVNNLNNISSLFQRFQQEDAHEFLQFYLDKFENSLNSVQDLNIVKQVFGGKLVSKLKCCNCGHNSDTYESSIDLSLEIEQVDNLINALDSFTKVEKIEDFETQFKCENCNEKVSIEKQLLLDQTPLIASFHLKRFKSDGTFVEKIDKFVQFPQELDLSPYISNTDESHNGENKYELYGVVVHKGISSNSGHYYCFIRTSSDKWYKFDDYKVIRVREEYVMSQEAYILFYAKSGTQFFTNFIETDPLFCEKIASPKSVLDCMGPGPLNNFDSDVIEEAEPVNTKAKIVKPLVNEVDDVSMKSPEKVTPVFSSQILKDNYTPSYISQKSPVKVSSPEIYREEVQEKVYSYTIPRGHLRKVGPGGKCNRQGNDDEGTKIACTYLKKRGTGARSLQLMACMKGSQSEPSSKKSRLSGKGDIGRRILTAGNSLR